MATTAQPKEGVVMWCMGCISRVVFVKMDFWSERALPKGVCRYGDKYRAAITVDHKQRHLGTFPTVEAASAAYQEARRRREEGKQLVW